MKNWMTVALAAGLAMGVSACDDEETTSGGADMMTGAGGEGGMGGGEPPPDCQRDVDCNPGERCVDNACEPIPPMGCAPIEPGEFGACEAVLGWGPGEDGACTVISGCGCDERCDGRVFDTQEACVAACEDPQPCPDADGDGVCDADDSACNADGIPLACRRVAPDCARGTVPEVRDGCYTDRCVTWAQCGEAECEFDRQCPPDEVCVAGACEPAPMCGRRPELTGDEPLFDRFEGTGFNNACRQDADCVIGGCSAEVCAAEPAISTCEGLPSTPSGGCGCVEGQCIWYIDQCGGPAECAPIEPGEFGLCEAIIGWGINADGQCGQISGCGCDEACEGRVFDSREACDAACAPAPCPDADGDGACDQLDEICNVDGGEVFCDALPPRCEAGTVPQAVNGCWGRGCVTWGQCAELVEGQPQPQECGGFLGLPCPEGQICVDAPGDDCDPNRGGADCPGICEPGPAMCSPIEEGEFGLCLAILGWGPTANGGCQLISGCGCNEACEGRIFDDEASCQAACGGPEPICREDADADGICDNLDDICNLDDTPLQCRQLPPRCPEGTVVQLVDGCWGRCVPWDACVPEPADPQPQVCGGFVGARCPAGQSCQDDPRDDCDNANGGADCPGLCIDDEVLCSPVAFGEFGDCRAVIGWGVNADGVCGVVSGCGCDERCVGRVFPDERACQATCAPRE